MIPSPPEFSVPPSRTTKLIGSLLSTAICGLVGWGLQHLHFFWSTYEGPVPTRTSHAASLTHRFRLSADLTEQTSDGDRPQAGRPGPVGGSLGTNSVDPGLLSFKREIPSVNLDTVAPLPQRDSAPTFAGEATLPQASNGDGNPSGHGFGFGYGTGEGSGEGGIRKGNTSIPQAVSEWGVTKRVKANYPQQALKFKIQGYVVVLVTIDENGIPINAKPVKGSDILMAEALRVVLLWRFERPAKYGLLAPVSFPVIHKFELTEANIR